MARRADNGVEGKESLGFEERQLVERFTEILGEARRTARSAPDGMVIESLEDLFLSDGRELLRKSLETVVQLQAEELEAEELETEGKKGRIFARTVGQSLATKA